MTYQTDHLHGDSTGPRCVGSAIHPDGRNADFLKHVSGKRRSSSAMLDEALLSKARGSPFWLEELMDIASSKLTYSSIFLHGYILIVYGY